MTSPPDTPSPAEQQHARIALLPRISMDVFCENQATREVLEGVAKDRHLAKVRKHFHQGGIAEAVEFYRQRGDSPELVVVESSLPPENLPDAVGTLADACGDPGKLVVIGQANDIELYRTMMNLGVGEYLNAPLTVLHVVTIIADLYADPEAAPLGRCTAFIGARGGVGSSTMVQNTAWSIARELKLDVSMVDLNLTFGHTGLSFYMHGQRGTVDALTSPDRLDESLLDGFLCRPGGGKDQLGLLFSDVTLDENFDNIPLDAYETVLEVTRRNAPHVLLDVPRVWTDWSRHALLSSDNIVVTASLDLVSMRNAKNIIAWLKQERSEEKEPYLLLNRLKIPRRREVPLQQFIDSVECRPYGKIPYDARTFSEAENNGVMLGEVKSGGGAAGAVLNQLAHDLVGRHSGGGAGGGGMFSRFRRQAVGHDENGE